MTNEQTRTEANRATPPSATNSRRPRRFRLGWLSWLVLLVMLAAMTVIILPGANRYVGDVELRRQLAGEDFDNLNDVIFAGITDWKLPIREHGWPLVFLQRYAFESLPQTPSATAPPISRPSVSWMSPAAWSFTDGTKSFHLPNLLADLVIGLACIICVVAGCEHWRRKRGRLRFSLLDVAVMATLASVALGWWQYNKRQRDRESEVWSGFSYLMANFDWNSQGGMSSYTPDTQNLGPEWLARLTGDHPCLDFCHRLKRLNLITRARGNRTTRSVRDLTNLEHFRCTGPLTPLLAESLASLPRLRELAGPIDRGIRTYEFPMLTSADIGLLLKLPRLESLDLTNCDITTADLPIVMQLPQLNSLKISGPQFLIEDLAALANHPKLRTIHALISATDDERKAFAAAHPNINIDWPELPIRPPSSESYLSDPWHVLHVRVGRWRGQDDADREKPTRQAVLNLSGLTLTRERFQQIPSRVFAGINEIRLGRVDSPATALDLIERCPRVEYVDLRNVPIGRDELARLCRHDSLRSLKLRQGPLTLDELCQLSALPNFKWLEVYDSTLTPADATRLRDALCRQQEDAFVDVFAGLSGEPAESILSVAD